jgi:hypothetical protein
MNSAIGYVTNPVFNPPGTAKLAPTIWVLQTIKDDLKTAGIYYAITYRIEALIAFYRVKPAIGEK